MHLQISCNFRGKNSKKKTLNTLTRLLKTKVPYLLFDKNISVKKGMKLKLLEGVKAYYYYYPSKIMKVKNNTIYGKKKGYAYLTIVMEDGSKNYNYKMHLHFV